MFHYKDFIIGDSLIYIPRTRKAAMFTASLGSCVKILSCGKSFSTNGFPTQALPVLEGVQYSVSAERIVEVRFSCITRNTPSPFG